MKRRLGPQGGYTIIEVIIFLTVSSALMASAAYIFQDRIPRTQFTNAVNEFDSKIQDAINDVTNGYYPTGSGTVACGVGVEAAQGTNEDCIFLGRVMQFAPGIDGCAQAVPTDKDCDKVRLYTVFGDRLSGGKPATKLDQTAPRLINSGGGGPKDISPGYGINITRAYYVNSAGVRENLSGVAFLQSFGSWLDGTDTAKGSQHVRLLVLTGVTGEQPDVGGGFVSQAQNRIINQLSARSGVVLCLEGGLNQYATVTIGGNNSSLATQSEILNKDAWSTRCV